MPPRKPIVFSNAYQDSEVCICANKWLYNSYWVQDAYRFDLSFRVKMVCHKNHGNNDTKVAIKRMAFIRPTLKVPKQYLRKVCQKCSQLLAMALRREHLLWFMNCWSGSIQSYCHIISCWSKECFCEAKWVRQTLTVVRRMMPMLPMSVKM